MNEGRAGLLSILIPVYNERAHLARCIRRVIAAPLPGDLRREIVLVNDASTDGTAELVDELARRHPDIIRAFHQPRNRGKGAAIRRAISEMRGDFAIFQDADLEYDPSEYGAVLRPLLDGRADVVYGSRFATRAERRVLNFHHELGNRLLTTISNWLTGLNLTDMETCYKAFRADLLRSIPLRSNRFGIEPEITAKIAHRRFIVYEVPVSYYGRGYDEGKKIGWRDGFNALYVMLKYRWIEDCYSDPIRARVRADLSNARRYNRAIYRRIRPYLGRRILEMEAGIGLFSRRLPQRERLTLAEGDPACLRLLRDRFRDSDVAEALALNPDRAEDFAALPAEGYDTILGINLLQTVEDDAALLRRLADRLAPGGRILLWLPAHPALFGEYDRALGIRRRYDRRGLRALAAAAGLRVERLREFNFLGLFGWWINSRLLRRRRPGRVLITLMDWTIPVMHPLERALPLPGLHCFCVLQKPLPGDRAGSGAPPGGPAGPQG